ncbi:hypothetical protein F5878DRAFT_645405 [Lentinula raphanica]|uniref:Uncharacterized protein n=1 Tax=Lentinula raphanica TaxID=153919 RepID=A0AA38P0T3_9AGAR|nr:hypothetical protein F5880DRAFT_1507891 [Lentinula raphanica]KAJ3834100.1 hypothetical protein F5878DRAFT_645405 [Lentinula raphanica]
MSTSKWFFSSLSPGSRLHCLPTRGRRSTFLFTSLEWVGKALYRSSSINILEEIDLLHQRIIAILIVVSSPVGLSSLGSMSPRHVRLEWSSSRASPLSTVTCPSTDRQFRPIDSDQSPESLYSRFFPSPSPMALSFLILFTDTFTLFSRTQIERRCNRSGLCRTQVRQWKDMYRNLLVKPVHILDLSTSASASLSLASLNLSSIRLYLYIPVPSQCRRTRPTWPRKLHAHTLPEYSCFFLTSLA